MRIIKRRTDGSRTPNRSGSNGAKSNGAKSRAARSNDDTEADEEQLACYRRRPSVKRRNKLVKKSGVIVQNVDGTLEAVTPEEARKRLDAMEPERRAMYEGEIEPDKKGQEELIEKQKFHHKL